MFSQGLGLGSISTVEINVQDWVRRVDFGEVLLHTLIEGQIPFEGSPRTSPFVIYFEGKQDLPLTIVKPFLRISFSWFIHRVTCCLYKTSQHNIKLKKTWQQSTTSKSNLKANPIDWVIVLAKHKRFLSCWKKPCPQVLQFAKIKNELLTCSNWALVLDTWVREVKQPTKSRDLSGTCSSGLLTIMNLGVLVYDGDVVFTNSSYRFIVERWTVMVWIVWLTMFFLMWTFNSVKLNIYPQTISSFVLGIHWTPVSHWLAIQPLIFGWAR